jgi:type I restriction enzyme S subunit
MTLELTIAYAVVPLEELIELIIDHRGKTPKKLGGDFTDYGVPAISAIHIKNGQIQWDERERYVSDAMFQKWMPIKLQKDDVLLTSEAPLGETALVPSDEDLVLSQRLFAIRCNKDSLDPTYFKYFLTSSMGQRVLSARASGSTVIGIRQAELLQIEVPHPDIKIQRTIGKILLSLDAKLQANKQLSKTLEDIAQTIFQSWFIDFDPVKGKMSGEKPVGMDAATAALFPDAMEDSELGLIPAGWAVSPLGEVVDLTWGDTKTTKASYVSAGYLAYSAKGQDGLLSTYEYDQIGIVLSAIGAGCGRTWLATGKWSCIKNTIRLLEKAKYPDAIPYAYLMTANPDFWPKRGSAQPFIGQEDSRGTRIIVPTRNLLGVFSQIVTPIYEQVSQLNLENVTLESIRNQILPPLISGELQIPEEMLAS